MNGKDQQQLIHKRIGKPKDMMSSFNDCATPITIGMKINVRMSLGLPILLCINCCWSLPFNAKPNAMLYGTNKYTMGESFKYGFIMSVLYWSMLMVCIGTYFSWLGITPGFF